MAKKGLREAIVKNVRDYPGNVAAALRLTARTTKTPYSTVSAEYYRKATGVRAKEPCFITQTPNGVMFNTKVVPAIKETKRTLKLESDVVDLSNLSKDDKVAFFDMIFS